jgi:polyhydroxybutyrate depolymerase
VATCAGSDWTSGEQSITLTHDGIERSYEVHVPASYSGTEAVPLLLVIHGAHNTPWMARSWSQMDPVADQNGFIVAYPAGLDCWNTGMILPGCTAADDDFGFILSVVADIESHACIDRRRVYATGISNGSMMAQYMGCRAADVFASVGGVAAGLFGGCSPSRPISVFYVHGTADTTVSYSPNAVDGWIDANNCDSPPVEAYSAGAATCDLFQGCDDGVEVEFCTVEGMAHCWPDNCYQGAYGSEVFGASPMMWEFFARHPLP